MNEKLLDLRVECGCYILGDWCYDRDGNLAHGVIRSAMIKNSVLFFLFCLIIVLYAITNILNILL